MNVSGEKKWFVYVEDHHEGPFTVDEVQQKIKQGAIRADQFVWCEGMQDWKAMTEVSDFSGFDFAPPPSATQAPLSSSTAAPSLEMSLQSLVNQAPPAPEVSVQTAEPSHVFSPGSVMLETHEPTLAPIGAGNSRADIAIPSSSDSLMSHTSSQINVSHTQSKETIQESTGIKQYTPQTSMGTVTRDAINVAQGGVSTRGGTSFAKRFFKFVFLMLVLAGAAWSYTQGYLDVVLKNPKIQQGLEMAKTASGPALSFITEKVPFLAPYLSPLPQIKDVSQSDYEELKTAALASLSTLGPQAAVVPATGAPDSVQFYVSSNLPNETNLVLVLEGIDETLLNTLDFKHELNLALKDHLAQTPKLTKVKGQPIPKGEYNIYVYEGDQQPASVKSVLDGFKPITASRFPRELGAKKVAMTKKIFLGGTKDKTYQDRLSEFHEKVKVRAQQDKEELTQVVQTLMNQYNASRSLFNSMKQKVEQKVAQAKGKKKGMDPAIKKSFNEKASKWVQFQAQINKFERWTPDYLQASFYPQVYERVKKASASLSAMHDMQSQYFNKAVDTTSFEKQLAETQDQAREQVTDLLLTMKTIEQSLTDNQGLPKKVQ